MISSYKIKKIGTEQLLILYLDYNYEIASDINLNNINNLIINNNIKWNGNKIILITNDIIIGSIILAKKVKNETTFNKIGTLILNNFNDINEEIGYTKVDFN